MKYFNLLMLLLLFFTSCKKDIEQTPPTNRGTAGEPGLTARLSSDGSTFARYSGYEFYTTGNTMNFVERKVAPLPTDTARYNEYNDSISIIIYSAVYMKWIERLPKSNTNEGYGYASGDYYYKDRGYEIIYSDFDKYYYLAGTYYSTSNPHNGTPNGRTPFTFATEFIDTVGGRVKGLGFLKCTYNPRDRSKFPF